MPNSLDSTFERVFPKKELFQGNARSAILWSTCASILLAITLFLVYLTADLLVTRGRLPVSTDDAAAVQEFLGEDLAGTFTVTETQSEVVYHDAGLLPTVWKAQDEFWGPAAGKAFKKLPVLHSNASALTTLVLVGALLGLLRSLWATMARRMSTQAGLDIATRLRKLIHQQRLRLGPGDLQDTEADHVLSLFTTDVDRVRDGVSRWVRRTSEHPFVLVMLLILALAINWRVTLLCLIPLAFCWYIVHKQKTRTQQVTAQTQGRAEAELRLLSECLQKTRLVRGYNMEKFESEQFQRNLDRLRDDVSTIQKSERISRWISRGAVTISASIVVWLLGMKILPGPADGGISFAGALVLLCIFAWMYQPLEELLERRPLREDAALAADRIFRYLDKIPAVGQAVGAKFLQPLSKMLTFDSVSYYLPNRRAVLEGLDLRIAAGTTVSVVSLDELEPKALAYLLPRFIEPHSGRVLFDGEDIAWVTLESLRAETIFVGASDPFFTGTVRENICCGNNEFPMQDATAAAKQAHANKFILDLPQGYETMLGEHGEQLDVGQGFRLGLARAILRNPALLIVEEPTEALDNDTKTMLDDTYTRMTKGRTTIFLPNRLSTVRRTDLVVLLHRGKVEAMGSHAEVVKNSEAYRHWEYLRYNAFRKVAE